MHHFAVICFTDSIPWDLLPFFTTIWEKIVYSNHLEQIHFTCSRHPTYANPRVRSFLDVAVAISVRDL